VELYTGDMGGTCRIRRKPSSPAVQTLVELRHRVWSTTLGCHPSTPMRVLSHSNVLSSPL